MRQTTILFTATLVASLTSSAKALSCYTCSNADVLTNCLTKTCPASEVGCYVQFNLQTDGTEKVNARCISDHTCGDDSWQGFPYWHGQYFRHGCCRGSDNCIPATALKLQKKSSCRVCQGESDINACAVEQCPDHQDRCFMQVNRDMYGKVAMFARCVDNSVCPLGEKLMTSKHFQTDICEACCDGDDCNQHLCKGAFPAFTGMGGPITAAGQTKGLQCASCSGTDCGRSRKYVLVQCPDSTPYCMNSVNSDSNGNVVVTKGCATQANCETLWWKDTSKNSMCTTFDINRMYHAPFTCNFCCVTRNCNSDLHPAFSTLYVGKDTSSTLFG